MQLLRGVAYALVLVRAKNCAMRFRKSSVAAISVIGLEIKEDHSLVKPRASSAIPGVTS
jgi:hypothetical protein